MAPYTSEQKAFVCEAFVKNNDSYIATIRKFRNQFKLKSNDKVPDRKTVKDWVKKFRETGSTLNKKPPGKPKQVRTPRKIEKVRKAFVKSPTRSVNKHASSLGISQTSVRRILHEDLSMHPYKLVVAQKLNPADHPRRKLFAEKLLSAFENEEIPLHNLLITDEAHFYLSGHVNHQNCRFWATENPEIIHEKPLHDPYVTVWAGVASFGIIGPYFFEERNQPVRVNKDRYIDMIKNFVIPELKKKRKFSLTWFQQDGATPHTAKKTIAFLKQAFKERIISIHSGNDIQWSPRSPDLSTCDYFLWGYLKSRVYENKPRSLQQLKQNIREEIKKISKELCHRAFENFEKRLRECIRCDGAHLSNVLFK